MSERSAQRDRPGNALACPHCLSPNHLGENVKGWRGVQTACMVESEIVVELAERHEFHAPVYDPERTSFFCSNSGCDVDRELRDEDLVQLDADGRPVREQPPEQERIL